MAVIIIPAYNEEGVLGASLRRLLDDLDPSSADVVVVCNGCTDRTAEIARSFAPRVDVLELEEASKTAAINAGEARNASYPRIYLDADVSISGASMTAIVDALSLPGVIAAEPQRIVDTSRSTALVKIYYTVALALHGCEPGDVGGGVYAMSEEGRKRFGLFPSVISDDAYARAHFASGEIHVIASAQSTVHAPRQLADLIEIATRSRLGDLEMQAKHPSLWAAKGATKDSLVAKALNVHPRLWPLFPIYAALKILIRVRAHLLYRTFDTYRWGRDESSR